MKKTIAAAGAALLAIVAGSASVTGQPQTSAGQPKPQALPMAQQCFYEIDFENWKAPDPQTMYIRVRGNRYFLVQLANKCYNLMVPAARLITLFHGSDLICSAVDWDLKVSTGMHDIPEPCIVSSMRPLSPAEVAAIPKKYKP
jgi:hypothetical protein